METENTHGTQRLLGKQIINKSLVILITSITITKEHFIVPRMA